MVRRSGLAVVLRWMPLPNSQLVNIRGKKVRFGKKRIEGKKKDRRKAIVTVKAGQKIDIFDIGQEKK